VFFYACDWELSGRDYLSDCVDLCSVGAGAKGGGCGAAAGGGLGLVLGFNRLRQEPVPSVLFRPFGSGSLPVSAHGLRRGLRSCAALLDADLASRIFRALGVQLVRSRVAPDLSG
jgi:hypothetical protein